jgi:hypothetical protein
MRHAVCGDAFVIRGFEHVVFARSVNHEALAWGIGDIGWGDGENGPVDEAFSKF